MAATNYRTLSVFVRVHARTVKSSTSFRRTASKGRPHCQVEVIDAERQHIYSRLRTENDLLLLFCSSATLREAFTVFLSSIQCSTFDSKVDSGKNIRTAENPSFETHRRCFSLNQLLQNIRGEESRKIQLGDSSKNVHRFSLIFG